MEEEEEQELSIFLDKKQLSSAVLSVEMQLIGKYAKIITDLNTGIITEAHINDPKWEYSASEDSWTLCFQLYNFLRYNKIVELKKSKVGKISKEIIVLEKIMKKFEEVDKEPVTFSDLKTIVPIIHRIISLSGYHDDSKRKDSELTEHPDNF